MSNTSATGGYLLPSSTAVEDDALEDIISAALSGVTGIDNSSVNVLYQSTNFQRPPATATWVGFTITSADPAGSRADITHDGSGSGSSTVEQQEQLVVLASFYGPTAQKYAKLARDGFMVPQNREVLRAAGLALVSITGVLSVPEVGPGVNYQQQRRFDVTLTINRNVPGTYAVENLLEAAGTVTPSRRPAPLPFATPTVTEGN